MELNAFQSTLPAGEATKKQLEQEGAYEISIHASRGGSDQVTPDEYQAIARFQSTLPAGEATQDSRRKSDGQTISIHASRGGSDRGLSIENSLPINFNPRFPRGKRPRHCLLAAPPKDFNPRFPRGKRRFFLSFGKNEIIISIHASRGGSDSTVKLSPDDRTSRHGFREPRFLRFRHRQISCLFLLGAWGSRL